MLEAFGGILRQAEHDTARCRVVLDARVLAVQALGRVLNSAVSGHFEHNVFADAVQDAVGIAEMGAELLVEGAHDVAQQIQFRLELAAATGRRHRLALGDAALQDDAQGGLFLDAEESISIVSRTSRARSSACGAGNFRMEKLRTGKTFFSMPFPKEWPQLVDRRLQARQCRAILRRRCGELGLSRKPQFAQRIAGIEEQHAQVGTRDGVMRQPWVGFHPGGKFRVETGHRILQRGNAAGAQRKSQGVASTTKIAHTR